MELKELKEKTEKWVRYYNSERLHQALEYKTSDEIYYGEGLARAS
ncbi:MAG: integrase core domain-containing protein [Thermotogaceae bacterium]|nr:integrase core domain-containing protein [Thermotogaceae bacterium]